MTRLSVFLLAILCTHAVAGQLFGRVVAIHDGDTLTVLVNREQVKIRLADIDAPELKQPFGKRSRQSLANLCHNKPAAIYATGTDRYKRTVAYVSCAGHDASTGQVVAGMAWVFRRYAGSESTLYVLEDDARKARRGLWADQEPTPPWEWRQTARKDSAGVPARERPRTRSERRQESNPHLVRG